MRWFLESGSLRLRTASVLFHHHHRRVESGKERVCTRLTARAGLLIQYLQGTAVHGVMTWLPSVSEPHAVREKYKYVDVEMIFFLFWVFMKTFLVRTTT